jgi:hypothetical protein
MAKRTRWDSDESDPVSTPDQDNERDVEEVVEPSSPVLADAEVDDEVVAPVKVAPLPPAAKVLPASVQSTPEPAKSRPASVTPPAARRSPLDFALRAEACPMMLKSMSDRRQDRLKEEGKLDARMEELYSYRPCQIIEDLSGRIGLHCPFHLRRSQIISLPLWFALQYPKQIVVKG